MNFNRRDAEVQPPHGTWQADEHEWGKWKSSNSDYVASESTIAPGLQLRLSTEQRMLEKIIDDEWGRERSRFATGAGAEIRKLRSGWEPCGLQTGFFR